MASTNNRATRDGFGEALVELGARRQEIVVLTGDLKESTRVEEFAKRWPERFIECGVAEQNMMGIAAGLAMGGKIPFVTSYAVFSPGRNWDQLRVSVCYSNLNVKTVGAHAGVSTGPDGATHQGLEDIAITRVLPNMTVVVPCDAAQAKQATQAMADREGPCYLRLTREATPVITTEDAPFEIGRAETLADYGDDAAILACGPLVYQALAAARELEKEEVKVRVVNNHTIKPMDAGEVMKVTRDCGAIVTVEEHQIMGGMGSAVAELLATNFPVPVEMIGMPDCFGESGQPEELLEKYGMSVIRIKEAVKKVISRKAVI